MRGPPFCFVCTVIPDSARIGVSFLNTLARISIFFALICLGCGVPLTPIAQKPLIFRKPCNGLDSGLHSAKDSRFTLFHTIWAEHWDGGWRHWYHNRSRP